MDWRERKYYLVKLNEPSFPWWRKEHDDYGEKYKKHFRIMKELAPSIKLRKPYNHFKYNKDEYGWDARMYGMDYVQYMVSCRKEHSEIFELNMALLQEIEPEHVFIQEITKQMCGQ